MADYLVNGVDDAPTSYATVGAAISGGAGSDDRILMTTITDEHSIAWPSGLDMVGNGRKTSGIVNTTNSQTTIDSATNANFTSVVLGTTGTSSTTVITGNGGSVVFDDCEMYTVDGDDVLVFGTGGGFEVKNSHISGFNFDAITLNSAISIENCLIEGAPTNASNCLVFKQNGGAITARNTKFVMKQAGAGATGYSLMQPGDASSFYGCIFDIDTSAQGIDCEFMAYTILLVLRFEACSIHLNAGSGTAQVWGTGAVVPGFEPELTLINSPTMKLASDQEADFDPYTIQENRLGMRPLETGYLAY